MAEELGLTTALLGAGLETVRGFGANETITIGCLGSGRRCHRLMQVLAKLPNVRLAGVCDVDDTHLNSARKLADPRQRVSTVCSRSKSNARRTRGPWCSRANGSFPAR